jgi:hypothetical protein
LPPLRPHRQQRHQLRRQLCGGFGLLRRQGRRRFLRDMKRCGAWHRFRRDTGRQLKDPFRVRPSIDWRGGTMTSPSSLLAMMALIGLAVVELFTHLLPWA